MGNFESHIPDYIELNAKEIRRLEDVVVTLYHDCDCKYCDRTGVDDEDKLKAVKDEIDERLKLARSLRSHAGLHGVVIDTTKATDQIRNIG